MLFQRCWPRALVAALAIAGATHALAQDWNYPRPLSVNPQHAEGFVLYQMHCAGCHGERGDGRGSVSRFFEPRPADFTSGVYKLRSTPSGTLPLDTDLTRTLTSGVHGTSMRCWTGTLDPAEVAEVLKTVKSFSPRFARESAWPPIVVPPAPGRSLALEIRGREVYSRVNCATCHGSVGRGDGPSSAGLTDDRGRPAHPHDFTMTHRVKAGDRPEDIYRSLATGLDGTPMHATDGMSEADRWALVYFLMSISEQPAPDLGRDGGGGRRLAAPAL